jgi:hypothetical protein
MALVTNRQFRSLPWVRDIARQWAEKLLRKDDDASGLLDLSSADALELLSPEIPRFIKAQKSTGLWRSKNTRAITYSLLKALAHTGLHDTVVRQLRHDPYQPFREADDWYGIAVRCQLLQQPHLGEAIVKDRLRREIAGQQQSDGSWEHTVVATVHYLEILMEAGLSNSQSFASGIDFLFASLQPDVVQQASAQTLAHQMFTSVDRRAEFRGAERYKPHWTPANACYCHLPMMQTGCALRLLNTAGYEEDPRVLQACQNLVGLYDRFGGWCASNIHHGLKAERKERRRL